MEKNGKVVKCNYCNKNTYKSKNHLERAKYYFCSRKCHLNYVKSPKIKKVKEEKIDYEKGYQCNKSIGEIFLWSGILIFCLIVLTSLLSQNIISTSENGLVLVFLFFIIGTCIYIIANIFYAYNLYQEL